MRMRMRTLIWMLVSKDVCLLHGIEFGFTTTAISTLACSYPIRTTEQELVGIIVREKFLNFFCSSFSVTSFSRQIQYRIMAIEGVNVVPFPAGPPDQNTGPPGREHNNEYTLRQLNPNTGTMTQLLTEVCARLPGTHRAQAKNAEDGIPFLLL